MPGTRISPFPGPFSPAFDAANSKAEPGNGFYCDVNFVGAFGQINWAADWATLANTMRLSGLNAGRPNYPLAQSTSLPTINNAGLAAAIPAAILDPAGNLVINIPQGLITGAASFQWQLNGVDIPGATMESLSLANAMPGTYRVVVSNGAGSVNSSDIPVVRVSIVFIGGVKVEGPATNLSFESRAALNQADPFTAVAEKQEFTINGVKYMLDTANDGQSAQKRFFRAVPATPAP